MIHRFLQLFSSSAHPGKGDYVVTWVTNSGLGLIFMCRKIKPR